MRYAGPMKISVFASAFFLALSSLSPACVAQQKNAGTVLQRKIIALMSGKPGAVVVLDVSSGKIVAQSHLEIAARRVEPPGSAIKPFLLRELLDLGRIQPEQRLLFRRPLYIGKRRMDCTHSPAVTAPDAADALAYSCNSYFAAVAARLSAAEEEALLRRMGFASTTGLAASEAVGNIMPTHNDEQRELQALGAWGVEVTPLELLTAYRNLALQRRNDHVGAAGAVFEGLEHSVQYGMAHAAQPAGTTAAGKTGTSAGPRDPYTHGFFAGYAPADKPEIVLVVYLEHGRGSDAAAIAGPIFTAYWRASHSHGDGK